MKIHPTSSFPPGARTRLWVCTLAVTVFSLLVPDRLQQARGALPVADLNRSTPVDFESEILPVFRRNCLACHGTRKPKGGLVLETPRTIAEGSDSGPVVVPGNPDESYLLLVAAHQEEDSTMPPAGNKVNAANLTPKELGLLRLWITQGATGQVSSAQPVAWHRMPDALRAIHTVALSEDGQFAACGRANQIDLYRLPLRRFVQRLRDPHLAETGLYPDRGAAHRDMVQSLAFSPDGTRLASGGYRVIKLWRRHKAQRPWRISFEASSDIGSAVASPDGTWLAIAHEGGDVTLWKASDGSPVRRWKDAPKTIIALSFAPGGEWLAGATASGEVWIWDVAQGALLLHAATEEAMRSLAFAGQADLLLVAGLESHGIKTWRWRVEPEPELEPLAQLEGHAAPVAHLARVPGKPQQLISAAEDGAIRLWDLDSSRLLRTWNQAEPLTALAVAPDTARLASAGSGVGATLWDMDDAKEVARLKGDRHADEAVRRMEREKSLAAAAIGLAQSDLAELEKELKTQEQRLQKATQTFEPAQKLLTEKAKALEDAKKAKVDAETALAALRQEIQQVTEAYEAAQKASEKAQTQAQAMTRAAAAAQSSATLALQAHAEAEQFLAEATRMVQKAQRATAVPDLTDEAKQRAQARLASAEAVVENARKLRQTAEAQAQAAQQQAGQAESDARQAIEEVASAAFAAGKVGVAFDALTQDSETRLAESTQLVETTRKTVEQAEQQWTKAEMDKSQAETELNLARAAKERLEKEVEKARTTVQQAETTDRAAAKALEAARQRAEQPGRSFLDLVFVPDHDALVSLGIDGRLYTWQAGNGEALDVHEPADGSNHWLRLIRSGADRVVALGRAGMVCLQLQERWELEKVLGSGGPDSPLVDRVNALEFSPDGQWLASGGGEPSRSGEVKVWNVAEGTLHKDLPNVHSDTVLGLSFTRDGALLASGSTDKFARVIDTTTWEVVGSFEGHTHHVMDVSWKGDGRTLATSGADNVVKVWDARKGERKKNIEGFNKEVTSIQFVGPTSHLLVSAGDASIRLMQEDGKSVRAFSEAKDFQHAADITPDGRWVVAGGEESILRVWSGKDGELVASFAPPDLDP